MDIEKISISDFRSKKEKQRRVFTNALNSCLWVLILFFGVATYGIILIFYFGLWVFNWVFAEIDIRKLRSLGVTISETNFSDIYRYLNEICTRMQIKKIPTIIIINQSVSNAFVVRYSSKHVIVLCSQLLEMIISNPNEIKFILGHEVAHIKLHTGIRGIFKILQTPAFHAAREMSCDNAGLLAAVDIDSAIIALRKLVIGANLASQVTINELESQANEINSGVNGLFVRRLLDYPPVGERMLQLRQFASDRLAFVKK